MNKGLFLLSVISLVLPFSCEAQQTKVNMSDVANVLMIKKACKEGDGFACFALGRAYQLGKGAELSLKLAHESFLKSCDLGCFDGCFEVGEQYSDGQYVKKDKAKKEEYYQKACDLGSVNGCYYYGLTKLYEEGKENEDKAKELLRRACELGHPEACRTYKNLLPTRKKK